MAKIIKSGDKFLFDACDGTPVVEVPVWVETSKKNDKHPEGKAWIKLPKGNVTNRQYFSVDLFETTNVDGEVEVEVKTAAPRILGSTGVKQGIVKFLNDEDAAEYTSLVEGAVSAYKNAKASNRRKKPEEMTEEELVAYIEALKSGTSYKAATTGPKSFMDMFTDEQYNRYNELVALAQENKANAPRAKRGPLTEEEKAIRVEKRKANEITKAEKLLAALKASYTTDVDDEEEIVDDIVDEEDYE